MSNLFWSPVLSRFDVGVVAVLSVVVFFSRKVLSKLVFEPLTTAGGITKPSIRNKMTENLWYCFYYPTMLLVGWSVCRQENFFPWNENHYFDVFPSYDDFKVKPSLYAFFMFQLSFYVQGLVAHVTFETKRKDFLEILIHHLVTIALMVVSYCASQHRIGLCVLFVHDMSDVLLYSTKVFHYLDTFGSPRVRHLWSIASHISFVVFAGAFAITRNYIFPRYIIYPCMVAGRMFPFLQNWTGLNNHMCPKADCVSSYFIRPIFEITPEIASQGGLSSFIRPALYLYDPARTSWFEISHLTACIGPHCFHAPNLLVSMMMVLEVLHVFWMFMILRMVWKITFAKKHAKQDIRSDDEEDNDDDDDVAADKKKRR